MKNTTTLRIVADRNIPFIKDALAGIGTATYLPGDAITPDVMHDADILLTRTRTKCNSALLDASPCTFIGTATIGTDHIDLDYCRSKGIEVANAPGCNAPAVGQYVLAAIARNLKPGETFCRQDSWHNRSGQRRLACRPLGACNRNESASQRPSEGGTRR